MPTPSSGWDTPIGLGNETTWGTAVARTKFIEHAGIGAEGFSPRWASIPHPAFRGLSLRRHDRGLYGADLELTVPLNYEGLEFLFYHLFQKAPSISTPGGGTLAREQAYTFDDATLPPAGLTVECEYGFGSGSVAVYIFEGVKLTGATINLSEDRPAEIVFRGVARRVQSTTVTAATYPTELPAYWSHVVAKKATTAFDFRSASIEIDLGMNVERRAMGSLFMKEPVRGAQKRSIKGRITTDWEDATTLHNLLAGTGTSPAETALRLQFTITHPDANSIETGQAYMFNLDLPVCFIERSGLAVPGVDIVPNEVEFFTEADSSEIAILTTRNKVTAVP